MNTATTGQLRRAGWIPYAALLVLCWGVWGAFFGLRGPVSARAGSSLIVPSNEKAGEGMARDDQVRHAL